MNTSRLLKHFSAAALVSTLFPSLVHAQNEGDVSVITGNTNWDFIVNLKTSAFIVTAINTLLGLAGVGSFVFLLWGGVQWITAGSDKDAVEKARKKITNALIGLIIVFSAYAIIYILRTFFQVNIVGFTIAPLSNI